MNDSVFLGRRHMKPVEWRVGRAPDWPDIPAPLTGHRRRTPPVAARDVPSRTRRRSSQLGPENFRKSSAHRWEASQGHHHRSRAQARHHRQRVMQIPQNLGSSERLTDTVAKRPRNSMPSLVPFLLPGRCSSGKFYFKTVQFSGAELHWQGLLGRPGTYQYSSGALGSG